MPGRREDLALKRARAHIRRILENEDGRPDAAAIYSLIATHLIAKSLKLQTDGPGRPSAKRFLHALLVQLRDDLQQLGVDLRDIQEPRILTG
jgi:hypothetical protein